MVALTIDGGVALRGRITPSANKNAVLPVLCATLLTDAPIVLRRVPDVTDVRKILQYFRSLGSKVEADLDSGRVRLVHPNDLDAAKAPLPVGMRSSLMLIPALLHRFGGALLEHDAKGCTLGTREIDPHLEIFQAFGAKVTHAAAGLRLAVPDGFKPIRYWADYASVTATENFLLCAAGASGRSQLVNAACEPHVQEFCAFMTALGVEIHGVGASRLAVTGGGPLGPVEFTFADDFHEIATFLALGAITGGEVAVRNGAPEQFGLIDRTFAKFGVEVRHDEGWSSVQMDRPMRVQSPFTRQALPKVEAAPWPYLPADLLPIFIALGARADGSMLFWNKVYDGALGWMAELAKFGAQAFPCDPHRVITYGGRDLTPAEVESPYIIRVAIALLMVAASIPGRSRILNADPIRRAHPGFAENLRALGAVVDWEGSE